jgi:predicted DNA binding protein
MVVELSIRLKHNCPFLEFSTYFGKKPIYHYCSSVNDYLIVPEKLSEEKEELARTYFGRFENLTIKEIGNKPEITYISIDCPCNDSLTTNIGPKMRELKGIPIYPITYQNGFEYYRIYCKNPQISDEFIKKMNNETEFEVLSKEDLGNDWLVSQTAVLKQLIDVLTPLQIDVLKQAFEGGYYNIPRNTTTEKLAIKNNKSRYAIEKNIRTAENKILNYIMPFIYLHQSDVHIKPCIMEKLPIEVKT